MDINNFSTEHLREAMDLFFNELHEVRQKNEFLTKRATDLSQLLSSDRSRLLGLEGNNRDLLRMVDELKAANKSLAKARDNMRLELDAQKQISATTHVELRGKLRRQRYELRRLNRQVNNEIARRRSEATVHRDILAAIKAGLVENKIERVQFPGGLVMDIPIEEMSDGTDPAAE
jgi:hypothetical protein